jgi:hypothetical protein
MKEELIARMIEIMKYPARLLAFYGPKFASRTSNFMGSTCFIGHVL